MRLNTKENSAFAQGCIGFGDVSSQTKSSRAFTLVEVLVVISIITLLMSISLPVFTKVRQQARWVVTMSNQKEVVNAVNEYAVNNDNSYPDSTATINFGRNWSWQAPTLMTACKPRPGKRNRSMSSYLSDYIDNADILFCPNAPHKNDYLQQAWDAGDDWDNPLTTYPSDPFSGVYCFFWNYLGYLGDNKPVFRGPRGIYAGSKESTLLVSCYLGYDYYRSPEAFVSCERFDDSEVSTGTEVSSDYWSCCDTDKEMDVNSLDIKLHAGFIDGHVESYYPSKTVRMDVAGTKDGRKPYDDGLGLGPGVFFLPETAIPRRHYR